MEILLVLVIILFFYGIQSNIYINTCYKKLSVKFNFKDKAIFEGEETELIQNVTNKKWMPIWWMRIQYLISSDIKFEDDEEYDKSKVKGRAEELALLGYQKLQRSSRIVGSRRGYYKISDVDLITSDLFVTSKIIKRISVDDELFVFPKLLSSMDFFIRFDKLLGEVITRRQLIQDPFEMRGIREYSPYDSLKDVNWKATAKTGDIKVNQYNFTASEDVVIFLSKGRENSWINDATIEEAISLVATLNNEFAKNGVSVALITDAIDKVTEKNIRVPSGFDNNHEFLLNKELATIDIEDSTSTISSYMDEEVIKGNTDPLWIVISNYTGDDLKESIINARNNNFDVKWIVVKDREFKIEYDDFEELLVWDVG